MKRWLIGVITGVFVIGSLVFIRDHAVAMWNTPEKVDQLEVQFTESYSQTTYYIKELQQSNQEQRTANELNGQKWHQQEIDNDRRWTVMVELMKK